MIKSIIVIVVVALVYGGLTIFDRAKNISGYHNKPSVDNIGNKANILKEKDDTETNKDNSIT